MMPAREPLDPVLVGPVDGIERHDRGATVRLAGELDLFSVPIVRKALLELAAERPGRLVIDLSAVEFIDSTALGALVEAKRQIESAGSRFLLAAPGSHVRRALSISGLDRHLGITDSVEQALEAE